MSFEQVIANLANVVKAGYKSNAYAPIVWFNAIILPIFFTVALCLGDCAAQIVLIYVACGIVIFSAIMYLVIFIKDPKLLQSERFRIEDRKLDLVSTKGADFKVLPVDLSTPPQLSEGGTND